MEMAWAEFDNSMYLVLHDVCDVADSYGNDEIYNFTSTFAVGLFWYKTSLFTMMLSRDMIESFGIRFRLYLDWTSSTTTDSSSGPQNHLLIIGWVEALAAIDFRHFQRTYLSKVLSFGHRMTSQQCRDSLSISRRIMPQTSKTTASSPPTTLTWLGGKQILNNIWLIDLRIFRRIVEIR